MRADRLSAPGPFLLQQLDTIQTKPQLEIQGGICYYSCINRKPDGGKPHENKPVAHPAVGVPGKHAMRAVGPRRSLRDLRGQPDLDV